MDSEMSAFVNYVERLVEMSIFNGVYRSADPSIVQIASVWSLTFGCRGVAIRTTSTLFSSALRNVEWCVNKMPVPPSVVVIRNVDIYRRYHYSAANLNLMARDRNWNEGKTSRPNITVLSLPRSDGAVTSPPPPKWRSIVVAVRVVSEYSLMMLILYKRIDFSNWYESVLRRSIHYDIDIDSWKIDSKISKKTRVSVLPLHCDSHQRWRNSLGFLNFEI